MGNTSFWMGRLMIRVLNGQFYHFSTSEDSLKTSKEFYLTLWKTVKGLKLPVLDFFKTKIGILYPLKWTVKNLSAKSLCEEYWEPKRIPK